MRLSDSREGDRVKIVSFDGDGAFKKRLLELGFMRGTILDVIKYAPLKDPIEVSLRGFHVTLRIVEAVSITVEKV